ncbi:hypothetical protein [Streptomyces candidus]|uniref:Hydrogenase expression protein HypF n=1 Tax=Streptomyces candidus TaxID=67283 RepID=A0A7X0HHF1_9ACTN|nr:hypothetical protein [Streptomyces candidus]MBB6437645.1 hypothetical protein [Streptomyces candidus]GHH53507.1 hypothetical protein GCM10018773_55070 [Streptomyces candidus]
MRGEEAQGAAGGGVAPRRRGGPRHAAPKKSLLTRFQLPAGKALALAAMPTAVFVGMSLTPKPAMAAGEPANPFAPGPCVTQPDEPDKNGDGTPDRGAEAEGADSRGKADAEAGKDAGADKGAEAGADGEPGMDKGAPAPGATEPPAGTDARTPSGGPTTGAKPPAAPPASTPTPAPAEKETHNPLDPLGVGPKIKDFFDGLGAKKDEPPARPSPPAPTGTAKPTAPEGGTAGDAVPTPATTSAPADAGGTVPGKDAAKGAKDAGPKSGAATPEAAGAAEEAKKGKDARDAEEKADEAAGKAKQEAEAAAARTEKAIRDAAAKLGIEVADFDQDGDGKPDLAPNADGTIPFPCPTADPRALAEAELEPGIPDLPDDPWVLETSMLTLRGLDYAGVVEVRTASGRIKKVLKFTAKETDIKDLHQMTVGPAGTTGHVQARKGSTSTLRRGTVTMYTEELKGNLFGLIPVTFSPRTPPPLNVPIAMFTDVKVTQAGQFGGTLTVPGLHNYFTGPGTGRAAG